MRLDFHGRLVDEPRLRAGVIGCGSHAFRNVCPTFQFAPVELVATCDLDIDRARAFARQFGAADAHDDHHALLARDDVDAIFIVTDYDDRGRPRYPALAVEALNAGKHVWIEKPPAASVAEIDAVDAAATRAGRTFMCGLKKMFAPANEKARRLIDDPDFGDVALATLQYPTSLPTPEHFARYAAGGRVDRVVSFLDHLCHPAALILLLLGAPRTLFYRRSSRGGATVATMTFDDGAVATMTLPQHAPRSGGLELTQLFSDRGRRVVVENNTRVTYWRDAPDDAGYGASTDFYAGGLDDASRVWQPEFSLGQLYNKGLFVHGYYNEVNAFARACLDGTPIAKGHAGHARQVTRLFEAFAQGPDKEIEL